MSRYYAEQTWDGLGHYPRPYPGKYRIPRGGRFKIKSRLRGRRPLISPIRRLERGVHYLPFRRKYLSGLGQAEGEGMFYDIGAKLDEWTHGGWSATESYQDKLAESFGLKKPDTAIEKTKTAPKLDCPPGFRAVGGDCVPICTTPPLTQWDVDTSTCVKPPFSFTTPIILGGVAAAGLVGYMLMRSRKK